MKTVTTFSMGVRQMGQLDTARWQAAAPHRHRCAQGRMTADLGPKQITHSPASVAVDVAGGCGGGDVTANSARR